MLLVGRLVNWKSIGASVERCGLKILEFIADDGGGRVEVTRGTATQILLVLDVDLATALDNVSRCAQTKYSAGQQCTALSSVSGPLGRRRAAPVESRAHCH